MVLKFEGTSVNTERQEIIYTQPIKLELERLANGKYKWTVSIHAENQFQAIALIEAMNKVLKERYIEVAPEV